MNPRPPLLACLVMLVLFAAPVVGQQTPEELFQSALYMQQIEGDLEGAREILETLIEDFADHREVAANALVLLGRVHETLGSTQAERAYRRVLNEYPEQRGAADEARTRLAALLPAPVEGRGPVARRLLSADDTDTDHLVTMMPSPDGTRAAYVDLRLGRLHVRDLGSGNVEELLPGLPAVWNWSPVWSPDGKRLAFSETAMAPPSTSIKIIDIATREVEAVPGTDVAWSGQGQTTGLIPVNWSSDGRLILYSTRGGELGVVPIAGGARTVLVDTVSLGQGGSFSPDGRYAAYAVGPEGSEQVFVQPVAGGVGRQITDAPGGNTYPLWSPGGSAIAYQRPEGIWVVPVTDGDVAGAPQLVYTNAATRVAFAWTAAGGLYLTLLNDALVPYEVAVDPATGAPNSEAAELPHHPVSNTVATFGSYNHFAWSPDRQRIAFAGWSLDRQMAIYAADGNATMSHTVAQPGERIYGVWWSGDGQEVLYTSRRDEGTTVVALNPATGEVHELLPRTNSRWPVSQSSDGRRTLYRYGRSEADSMQGLVVTQTGQPDGRLVAPATDSNGVPLGNFACLSPQGDRVFFVRQAREGFTTAPPDAAALWVVGSDSSEPRMLGTAAVINSGVSDPSGRLIAYTAMVDSVAALRIVDVASGVAHDVALPADLSELRVTDWSRDGKSIGYVARQSQWEYWVVDGLLDATP